MNTYMRGKYLTRSNGMIMIPERKLSDPQPKRYANYANANYAMRNTARAQRQPLKATRAPRITVSENPKYIQSIWLMQCGKYFNRCGSR